MESINDMLAYKGINWSRSVNKLNSKEYLLIGNINIILGIIIKNILQLNKLTSADEIYEDLDPLQNNRFPEIKSENGACIKLIENICKALCINNGVLVKLEENGKNYYKLNFKEK